MTNTFDGSRVLNIPKQFGVKDWQTYSGLVFWSYHRSILSQIEQKSRSIHGLVERRLVQAQMIPLIHQAEPTGRSPSPHLLRLHA